MSRLRFFQVDSFTTTRFKGNPAAVVVLDNDIALETKAAIAAENNLSETAFILRNGDYYAISWFTPKVEVPLCGHGTLASAAVVMERLETGRDRVVFHSLSGPLTVTREEDAYAMDFPARPSETAQDCAVIEACLGVRPIQIQVNEFNYMAVLANAAQVQELDPNFPLIAELDRPGLIVTAPGEGGYDIVSRYFAPAKGIPEDPVTGGAHCTLTPYWSERLGKTTLKAFQASPRGGELRCTLRGDRVVLAGKCVFVIDGELQM